MTRPPPAAATTRPAAALRLLRAPQWAKNLVVLAPLVFAGRLTDPPSLRLAALAFAAFCLLASGGYAWNDLADVAADRAHPDKRRRPLASGALGRGAATGVALACTTGGLLLGAWLDGAAPSLQPGVPGPLAWLLAYALLGALYTLGLKRLAGLDVLALALTFVLRAGAGSAALQVVPSPWLLACGFCLALFLALLKRRAESSSLEAGMARSRPMALAWPPALLPRALDAAGLLAVASWVGYALASDTAHAYGTPGLLLLTPAVAYAVARARRLATRPAAGDPVVLLLTDGRSLAAFALWAAGVLLLLYRP